MFFDHTLILIYQFPFIFSISVDTSRNVIIRSHIHLYLSVFSPRVLSPLLKESVFWSRLLFLINPIILPSSASFFCAFHPCDTVYEHTLVESFLSGCWVAAPHIYRIAEPKIQLLNVFYYMSFVSGLYSNQISYSVGIAGQISC